MGGNQHQVDMVEWVSGGKKKYKHEERNALRQFIVLSGEQYIERPQSMKSRISLEQLAVKTEDSGTRRALCNRVR